MPWRSLLLGVMFASLAGSAGASTTRTMVVSVALDGSSPVTLATAVDALEAPVFSPDGRSVAYVRDFRSVELVGADGTGTRRLADVETPSFYGAALGPVWSPHGSPLIVPVDGYPLGGDPREAFGQLFAVDVTTGAITVAHLGGFVSFSHDGRYIAYQTQQFGPAGSGGGTIGVCLPDGTHDAQFGRGSYAAWAPTSNRVAYITRPGYLTVSGPVGQARWTLRTMKAGPIAWFPSGKRIAFVHEAPRSGLFVVTPGTRRVQKLVDLPLERDASPLSVSTSPDGRWIAVSSDRLTFVVRSDGTSFEVLSGGGAAWSPHASALAVTSDNHLVVWTPNRGALTYYTGRRELQQESWSPDGTHIVLIDNE